MLPKFFRSAYFALLCLLPAVLFFSYHPVISLGESVSMNYELSLPLIWLVLFDLIAAITIIGRAIDERSFMAALLEHKDLAKRPGARSSKVAISKSAPWSGPSKKLLALFALLAFPLYTTISVFWSENPLRTILTSGIIWLLVFAIFAIVRLSPLLRPPSRLKIWVLGAFFVSTALVCLFCFIQSLMDSWGLSREITLLCAGCTYRSFGFPHPSGFAIEPQFMGNLLLAPTLLALYLLCQLPTRNYHHPSKTEQIAKTERQKPEQRRSASATELARVAEPTPADGFAEPEQKSLTFPHLRKTSTKVLLAICAVLFSTTLFFTFSRGAIFSYALGLLILLILALRRHTFRPTLIIIPIATFALSLVLQGTFTVLGPTSETFTSAVTKSLHQLSLGIIDLRPEAPADTTSTDTPIFDGYVAASTDIRLGLSSTALATWSQSPLTVLFGVGLGGAGYAMHYFDPVANPSPKEIVQNQPISLLLETGLVGITLLLFALFLIFRPRSPLWAYPVLPLLLALIAAYLLSMQFFAGLPNALHIYLIPPLLYYLFSISHSPHFR